MLVENGYSLLYCEVLWQCTEWATKKLRASRFARVLVIFCLALLCILRRVFLNS